MSKHKILNLLLSTFMVASLILGGSVQAYAQQPTGGDGGQIIHIPLVVSNASPRGQQPPGPPHLKQGRITQADREAAAKNAAAARQQAGNAAVAATAAPQGGTPDYFGDVPNWAYSPLPTVDPNTGAVTGGGILKFTQNLPIPALAQGSSCSNVGYPGTDVADCYEIHLEQFPVQILPLPGPQTTIRGYVEYVNGERQTPTYLGPIIFAHRDRPVRIKFVNGLPTGAGGDLFIPVDTTYMGAGLGPDPSTPSGATDADCQVVNKPSYCYPDNRAVVHLHGGTTPWISDGTPHQWITPAIENTLYPQGVSVQNVPDMNVCGTQTDGCTTLYYTNQQSARLMFYHDHAYGITRLNVYAGEAAGYLLTDDYEQDLINGTNNTGVNPGLVQILPGTLGVDEFPLIIQDKSFVDANTVLTTDPTWNWGTGTPDANGIRSPVNGDLWYPHVYMTNQNPYDITGANAMGRWDYGPWFWPPFTGLDHGAVPNPYCLPTPPAQGSTEAMPGFYDCSQTPTEPPFIPGTPNPSGTPESFMDTPVVNGAAYPTLTVPAGLVRFRILSVANDRYFNLSLWKADPTTVYPTGYTGPGNTEVKMVPFNSSQNASSQFPSWWYDGSVPNPFDDRVGGVPDPATRGPAMIQIGTEGGFLPEPAVILNQPVNYVMNKRDITIGNIAPNQHSLLLGPAERADVLVDFSNFAGQTLIMYNDSPAPVPAADPRLDYFTGDPDQTSTGGAPTTLPGYGPNTRTVMKITVQGSGGTAPVDDINQSLLSELETVLPAAFAASQDTITVPQAAYNAVYGTTISPTDASQFVKIQDTTHSFTPIGSTIAALAQMHPMSLIEDFTADYGRMNALIGNEIPNTNIQNQTSIPQGYRDPPVELLEVSDTKDVQVTPQGVLADGTQLWKFTHNGVDTHVIHVHMFTAQLVNRVGWDGAIRGPEPNELGFKDTFRMNPLEDIVLAIRPIQLNLPFDVPNSIRYMDTTRPPLATNIAGTMGFTQVDPTGQPVNIVNDRVNFGWEYVFHCHILGHEENDMMRPMVIGVPPVTPSGLAATQKGGSVILSWTDNSKSETQWVVQRSGDGVTWANLATFNTSTMAATGDTVTYTDGTYKSNGTPYYYRVLATDLLGSTELSGFTASAGGAYPTLPVNSAPSNLLGPPTGTTTLALPTQAGAKAPIVLNWTYNAADQTGFTIQRATNNTFTSGLTIINVAGNVFTYSDSKIKAGTAYWYRVVPTNFLGSGTPSSAQTITAQ